MADHDRVSYCPARVDLLSHVQYSNYGNIQYLQIHNSDDEVEEGEQVEEYAEGSDMEEDGFDEDVSDVESVEDAPLEDDPAPIPNTTEGDRTKVKEDREIRSEKPEKPKEPEEDKQPKKKEPASPAPKKKAKNARKKEESKKKDKEKEKVKDKTKKSKPKTGKSKDAPKDAKKAAATMEAHPAQEPPAAAETPPAEDRPNEPPPTAADPTPGTAHDGKEAEPTPPPEPTAKEPSEEETKEDSPHEGLETSATSNEPTADKINEAVSGPEQEHTEEGDSSAPADPTNEASNNEPDEKGSELTPEPEKESDTSPITESPSEPNEKQSSQETPSKPEDGLDDGVTAGASSEAPLSEGLESATTESTPAPPQESTSSGETGPADVPQSEESRETTIRAPSDPAEEPIQVPNTSPEEDLTHGDTSSQLPEKTLAKIETLPEAEAEAASNEEKTEAQTPAADPIAPTAEESKVEDTSVESTQAPAEHGSDSIIEKGESEAEDPLSSESNEAIASPDLIDPKEASDDDNAEKQQQDKEPVVEQASTSADTENSHESATPEESTNPGNSSEVSVKSSDDTLDKSQAIEPASTERTEGDTEIQAAGMSAVDSVTSGEDIGAVEEDKAPKTDEGVFDVSAGGNKQQSDITGDSTTASGPENDEPQSEPPPQLEADKPLTPNKAAAEDQQVPEQPTPELATPPQNKTEDDKETLPSQQSTAGPTHTKGADPESLNSESQISKEDSVPDSDIQDATLQECKGSSDQPEPSPDAENTATTLAENQGPETEGDGGDRQGKVLEASREADEPKPAPDDGDTVPQPLEESNNSTEAEGPATDLSSTDDASPGKHEPQDEEPHSKTDSEAIDNKQTAEDSHSADEGSDGDKQAIEDALQGESMIAASTSNQEETAASTAEEDKEASGLQEIDAGTEGKQPQSSGSDVEETTPPIGQNDPSTEATDEEPPEKVAQSENVDCAEDDPSPDIKSDGDTTKDEEASDTMGDDSRPAIADQSPEESQSTVESSPPPIGDTTVVADPECNSKSDESEPSQAHATEVSNIVEHEPAQNGDSNVNKVEPEAKPDEGGIADPPEEVSGNEEVPVAQESIDNSSTTPLETHDPPEGEGVKSSEEQENIRGQTESENPGVESEAEQPTDEHRPSSSGEADSDTKGASFNMNEVPQEPRTEESSSTNSMPPESEITPELEECPKEQTKPAPETDATNEEASARENPTTEEILIEEKAPVAEAESTGEMTHDAEEADVTDEAPTTEAKPALEGTPAPQDESTLKEHAADEICHEQIPTTEEASSEQTSATVEPPITQEPGSAEVSTEKDTSNDLLADVTPAPNVSASDGELGTEVSEALNNMAAKESTASEASAVESDVQDGKTEPVIESVDEPTPPAGSDLAQAPQAETEAASEEVSGPQPDVESKEQAESPVEAESNSSTEDDPKMARGQIDQPKASGKTTPIAETEETRKQVTELEESKSQEDSTSNEIAATPTEPEKGTVMVSPSEQLTIGTSKAEGPEETTKVEDPATHEEQEDAIKSQEPVEEAVLPEEVSGAGEQAPSADTKDGALSQVVETATPEAKDTKVESPGSKDAVIEPEQPKEIASAEVTKPEEESSSQRAENSSVILKATTATEPEVVNESEVPKEVSEPAAVAEPVPSEPSEQTDKAVMANSVEGTLVEVEKERNELLADKEKSSAASNVQEEPQIAKDVADSTDYELSRSDSKTGTEEKEGSAQSETVKENPDSAEPIVEAKEASSNAAPSQDITASDSRVETLGETAPASIPEAPTDCPSPEHTEDPVQGLSRKELIERKIRMHQMQEDNECKDTVGPIPCEEIAARRASKGEDQSVPSCVRDTPDVIANDFGESTPELVLENVSLEEGLEGEGGSDEGEPGDKSTAGVQETALRQSDDSQSPVISQVRENKSTGPKINPEDSQHLLEEVSQEAVEGHPAKDTMGETHQLALPGEDPTESAHDLVKDVPEISESDRGLVIGNSQELANNELQSQPKEIMTTYTSEGVTPGGSSAEPQGEPEISETAERLIMQDQQPEQDPDNSRESSDHGIATSGDSTQTSIENYPIESKASEDYAASSSKHGQEDPVVNEEGQPGPTPTETLIEDPPSDPKVEQEPPETQLSTQSHSSEADVAQTEIETKATSTFPTEVNSTAGQNEDVADVAQQLSPSPSNTSQQDSFQREMNQDELNLEASDNTIDTDGISKIVAEPEQIAPVAIHSSEQSVKDTSHLSIINEDASLKEEATDTTETTSIQEENEAAVSRPSEDESEEQIHHRTKESVNDEPIPSSGTQDPERAITSSSDGVGGQALGSISSQESANNKGPSDVEEPTVEVLEIVEGQSSEDRDERIQESTPPPPSDHIEELTTQNSESTKSPSDQGIVETPAQEPVGVPLAKNPDVKASAPGETVFQVPDEATKDRLIESHEELPPSVEKLEESRSAQLEEQAPEQTSSDEELISTQKSTSIEESNVIEETRSVKGETVGKVEGKSNIELPTVTNDTEAGGQLYPSNSSESGAVVSSSADSDNDFILVERLDKDVLDEPIFKIQEPDPVTLGSGGEAVPPTKEKQDTPLHFPVKEATPGTRESEKTHIDKEGQTESEVNELVTGSAIDENDLTGHKTPEDLSIPTLESVVVLENSVKHDPETPESLVIIDKAHPATGSDNGESNVSTSGSHVIIERETDQSEDRGDIPGKAVQGHKESDQTMISDNEQTQPLIQSSQNEKLNSEVGSEELQVLGEVPVKPVGMSQIDASDKDHGNDSDSGDEARVNVIGSEVAGAAIIAAGSAMLALKPSAIPEPARSPSIIETVVSKDDVERGEGSSLGKIPLESAAESTPGVKNENVSAETPKATEKSEEVRDSSSQETSEDTEAVHTSPQFNSSDDSQSTQKKLSSTDNAVITESIAEKTNQQLRPATAESPELVASNTPLSEPFTVIDARSMKTKRSRHAFLPDLVHSGTQTDEDLDFASLWDRNLQCFFDLANMEPRSTTPGIVLPDLSDSKTKTLGRVRSVKKQRRQSYKRAEATIAAAVIIYAASQQLDPSKKEMLEGHQAKKDDGKELETSQEPTQEPHDISSGVAKARSVGRKEVSIADLSTDESSRSHHSDRHHRHRHHRHHHSSQSRDSNNSDEHHHHHRRHRRHRSSNPPVESYSDHSVPRKRESEYSVDSSRGHPSRRHRTAEEQAAHEKRKAERQARESRESYEVESRSKPREAPHSDRQSYHSLGRSSRSHSEPHPRPVKTEAPVVTPTKTSFDTKGHSVIEPNHAPRPTSRDTREAPRPASRDMRDVPRPISRDTRNAPVRDYSRTEPSRHSVQVTRPRRNSMDVRNTTDVRNSVDLSRSKSHRKYREDEDGSRRHRKDEPRADPSSTAAPSSVPKVTPELRDEPRHPTRREERQRVREAEFQRKPPSTGFRATLKKLFT